MKRNDLRKFNQKGMSLIEMMVATSVLGIVVGTVSTFYANMNRQSKVEYLKEVQLKIARDVESALSNPDAIANSVKLSGSVALYNCGNPGKTCSTTEPPGKTFTLYNTQAVPQAIAGGSIGFDLDGDRCTIGTAKCAFNPVVTFWATCDLNPGNTPNPTCTKPGYLNFKYEIKPIHPEHSKKMTSYPQTGNITSNTLQNVIRMRLTDMLIRIGDTCNPGEMLLGFDNQGQAQCECLVQKTIISGTTLVPQYNMATGAKICGEQRCPTNTLMTGYEEKITYIKGKPYKAVVPRCRSEAQCSVASPPADCPCKIVSLTSVGDCGAGFWMVSIDHGVCEATTEKGGKGAPETVKCATKTGRCCSFEQQ